MQCWSHTWCNQVSIKLLALFMSRPTCSSLAWLTCMMAFRCLQEIHLDKHIKLLDCPGIVMATSTTDAAMILRNCVKIEQLVDPLPPVEAILRRCNKTQVSKDYFKGTFTAMMWQMFRPCHIISFNFSIDHGTLWCSRLPHSSRVPGFVGAPTGQVEEGRSAW